MKQYLDMLKRILNEGEDRDGRNGKTRALFALQFRHDMRSGFPAITTKKLHFKGVVGELLWFLSGSTNDNDLKGIMGYTPDKQTIWSANADDFKKKGKAVCDGDLGRIYGRQWTFWRGAKCNQKTGITHVVFINQINLLVERLKENPNDRRLIVTAWNPADLDEMSLPACHVMFQLFAHADGGLSLSMIQRSCDMFLGVPFNIASYGLLLEMFAHISGRYARELVITFQDAHIYHAHFEAVTQQIMRTPHKLPTLVMTPKRTPTELTDYTMNDIVLVNYEHDEAIKAPMIV